MDVPFHQSDIRHDSSTPQQSAYAGFDRPGRHKQLVDNRHVSRGGDETLDPSRSLLSERYDGTFAERVAVPRRNLVPKPAALSFEEAACMPTAYLTAFRMLFDRAPFWSARHPAPAKRSISPGCPARSSR